MPLAEIRSIKAGKKPPNKRAKAQRQYRKLVAKMAEESDRCEIRSPVCIGTMGGMQHMKRRGKNLLNVKYLKRSCNPCNDYCERFPKWARENGHAISKHQPVEK